jgi:para-nitrobenzyl esterase
LVDQEQLYWTAFVKSGDPNAPGLPTWPKSGAGRAYLDFTSGGAVAKTDLRQAACGLYARKIEQDLAALGH